jgi:hypothetical protein
MSMTRVVLAALAVMSVAWMWDGPTMLAAQEGDEPEMIYMCYKQRSGVVYRVNPPDQPGQDRKLKDECKGKRGKNDVLFSWAELTVADGNVGIGTTTPTAALDVAGDIHASEELVIGENSITISDATNSITSTSGTISFDDENVVTTGNVTATSFVGDGAGLTNLPPGADGVSGYEIVTRTFEQPNGNAASPTLNCPAGKRPLGAGVDKDINARLLADYPVTQSSDYGWVFVFMPTTTPGQATTSVLYVTCAQVS